MTFPQNFFPSPLLHNIIYSECKSYRDRPWELDAASGTADHTPPSIASQKIASQTLPGRQPFRLPAGRRFERIDEAKMGVNFSTNRELTSYIRSCTSSCCAGAHSRLSVFRHDMTCHSNCEIVRRETMSINPPPSTVVLCTHSIVVLLRPDVTHPWIRRWFQGGWLGTEMKQKPENGVKSSHQPSALVPLYSRYPCGPKLLRTQAENY